MKCSKETGDANYLGLEKENEKILIFEEYACGGLEIIHNRIYKSAGTWNQSLLELVMDSKEGSKDIENIFNMDD